jgi:hypothetical protein
MPAHKRKPNYNGATTMQELLTAVCDYYGDPVDDRKEEDANHVSLHDVADEFDITVMKARKLLITGRTLFNSTKPQGSRTSCPRSNCSSDHRGDRPETCKYQFLPSIRTHHLQPPRYQYQGREAETVPCEEEKQRTH